jgi:2-oxoglutarate ferredoxin oxidoreductase subunit beta
MDKTPHVYDRYLIAERLPTMLCSGCGNGIVYNALLRAIDKAGLDQDKIVISSGIGCSGRGYGYMDFCGIHTAHGRGLAYATGVKMANPDLKVIMLTGDGDCTSIGGNHFIHACRRNIDITTVVMNNLNYGMTGGQYSPTTPVGAKTKTSFYGSIEPPFDVCDLAKASGATYVARASTYYVNELVQYICKGLMHKGFSVVEAMCDCPTLYGRINKSGTVADMMRAQKDYMVSVKKIETMTEEELAGKILMGEFVNRNDREEYTEKYDRIIALAGGIQ